MPRSDGVGEGADGAFDDIMGLRHKAFAVESARFPAESTLARSGRALLQNFLRKPLPKAA